MLINGQLAATYELTRRLHSRGIAIPTGDCITYRDLGGGGQTSIISPEIFFDALQSKLWRMIDARVSFEERRRLGSEGAEVLVQLEMEDGLPLQGAVGPPAFPYQRIEPAFPSRLPISERGSRPSCGFDPRLWR